MTWTRPSYEVTDAPLVTVLLIVNFMYWSCKVSLVAPDCNEFRTLPNVLYVCITWFKRNISASQLLVEVAFLRNLHVTVNSCQLPVHHLAVQVYHRLRPELLPFRKWHELYTGGTQSLSHQSNSRQFISQSWCNQLVCNTSQTELQFHWERHRSQGVCLPFSVLHDHELGCFRQSTRSKASAGQKVSLVNVNGKDAIRAKWPVRKAFISPLSGMKRLEVFLLSPD